MAAPSPISVAIEALWMTSRMRPQGTSYNEVVAIRKHGPVDVDALRQAFNALVSRHELWHSVVGVTDGEPVLISQPAPHFALDLVDLSELDPKASERQTVRLVADSARVPYDIARGPLIRPQLLRLPGDEHRLYLAMHHMIFDGISLYRTILPELVALYDGFADGRGRLLGPPQVTYADYARWEQGWIVSRRAERRLEYWRRQLTPLASTRLPTDEPRREAAANRGGTLAVSVSPASVARLHTLAGAAGASMFQVLGAVWAAFLCRLTGENDIVFGTPADLRQRSEFESVVGYCLSPLALRIDVSGDPTVAELVTRVRNEVLDGLDHLVPFERIVRELGPEAEGHGNPVYQTMLVLEPTLPTPDPSWSLHLMDSALGDAVGGSRVDLELQLDEHPDGTMDGRLIYDTDLFHRETAERLAGAWQQAVEAVAADSGQRVSELQLAGVTDDARQAEYNATATERLAGTVAELFAGVAAREPRQPAVTAGAVTASYGELHRAARTGASALRAAGVGVGDAVAVCLEPSVALVSAALAALEAGAAVLLLDPAAPAETLRGRIRGAGCVAALVADGNGFRPSAVDLATLGGRADPDPDPDLAAGAACILQPDLSRPELTAVLSHDTMENLVSALIAELGLGPGDTVLCLPEMLYDSPSTELWPALLAGGRLVFAPAEAAAEGRQLSKLIRAEGVTLLHATPPRWERLLQTGLRAARGLSALSGGEPLSRDLADRLLERCRVLWSAYTPALPGGYCTLGQVRSSGRVTIGRPTANHRAYVVDGRDQPVPVGFVGDLLIAGPLATSDDPPETALAVEPGGTGWARRTGQHARWLGDGRLELVSPAASRAEAEPPPPASAS